MTYIRKVLNPLSERFEHSTQSFVTNNEISISKERGSEFQRFIDSAEAISYKVRLERGTQLTYTCLSKWLFVYKY